MSGSDPANDLQGLSSSQLRAREAIDVLSALPVAYELGSKLISKLTIIFVYKLALYL